MSRAVELAKKVLGNPYLNEDYGAVVFSSAQLEVFYHAARAEALREAADEVHKLFMEEVESQTPRYHDVIECCATLRAMADREGK